MPNLFRHLDKEILKRVQDDILTNNLQLKTYNY